jgi:hypothetical protein
VTSRAGKGLAALALAAWLGICFSPVEARPQADWTIANDQLVVTISARTGGVESVQRKPDGPLFVNPSDPAEVLWLRMPVAAWDGHGADGGAAGEIHVAERTDDALVLRLGQFRTSEGLFDVEAEVRYRLDGDNLVVSLRLANHGNTVIDEISFPRMGAAPAAAGDEALFMPAGPVPLQALFGPNRVRSHHDPFQRLDPTDMRGWFHTDPAIPAKGFDYPSGYSPLHTAWVSYQAGDGFVGWDARDRTAQTQYFVIERRLNRDSLAPANNSRTYEMSWRWFPRVAGEATWESSEVYLKFGVGDWHLVAAQHRDWLETWVTKPRPPAAFQASLGWISQGVTSFDEIPGLARRGLEVGAPYFIVYGWFGYGMNRLSYEYYPREMLGGVDTLRRNLREARALGAYPLAWYNPTTTVASTPEHLLFGKDWVQVDRHGGMQVDGRWSLFDPDRPQTTDDATVALNYDMGTPVKGYVLEAVRRMIEDYGFAGFEFDQAAKNYVSYSPNGGPAPERSYSEGMREIYQGAMEIVRANDPNGVILGEGISDFMNQFVDASWLFEGGDGVLGAGGEWVVRSTFLRYSLPWVTFPTRAAPEDPGHANTAFLFNAPLDIFADPGAYPDYAAHLKRLHALKQEIYPRLFQGRFSDQEGFALETGDPATVLAKSYIEECCTTVLVINRAAAPQQARVSFPASLPAGSLTEYGLDGAQKKSVDAREAQLEIGPFGVAVLVFEHRKAGS